MSDNKFHLGLCMAGSISAGAYTAGVMDYLLEALENWEKVKTTDPDVPNHQVVIDLMCGSSGGGITSAMTQFAMHDKIDHASLAADGKTYTKPADNIFWNSWVELTGGDVFQQILATDDITSHNIRSVLNAGFIDIIAQNFHDYILQLSKKPLTNPSFAGIATEMFVTLFNITGINYELHSKAITGSSAGSQYITDHRDMAHFRWTDDAEGTDGRMHISLSNLEHLPVIVDAAKATGAFPVGLRARLISRKAKYIWNNPYFNRDGDFDSSNIYIGEKMTPDTMYTSINGDGGVANNEPVEIARNILLNQRVNIYKDISPDKPLEDMNKTEKMNAATLLTNSTVILIDPFPAAGNSIDVPGPESDYLLKYSPTLMNSMRSQLLFDAKEALDAYRKENYGLHIISPSKPNFTPDKAIACGSLGGFGGFLEREFRVHDFFLGRHNCQSFLRKYFVVDPEEKDPDSRACVESVISSYNSNPSARKRFGFKDEHGKEWVPIIPDVSLTKPLQYNPVTKSYDEENKLVVYNLQKLPPDFLNKYGDGIASRYVTISTNLLDTSFALKMAIRVAAGLSKKGVSKKVIDTIYKDFKDRALIQ